MNANISQPKGQFARKAAAILEVMGIYAAGQLLAFLLAQLLGIPLQNPLTDLRPNTTSAELLPIAWQLAQVLLVQYAGWLGLAFVVGWWHRRRRPAQYGLTRVSRPLGFYLVAGVVLFAFAELPSLTLGALDSLVSLGAQAPWRESLSALDWSSVEFWLFMAVGSYGLVAVLEELFYRGYCQTRLQEDLGGPAAIVAVATLFALSHSQYYILNVFNVGMLLSTALSAVAWGYVYYRTRSLLPTIVAHVLVNVPLKGVAQLALPLAMLAVCFVARREIYHYLVEFVALLRGQARIWQVAVVAALFGLFAVAFALLGDVVVLLGIALLVAALVLEALDKRRTRRAAEKPSLEAPAPAQTA